MAGGCRVRMLEIVIWGQGVAGGAGGRSRADVDLGQGGQDEKRGGNCD